MFFTQQHLNRLREGLFHRLSCLQAFCKGAESLPHLSIFPASKDFLCPLGELRIAPAAHAQEKRQCRCYI